MAIPDPLQTSENSQNPLAQQDKEISYEEVLSLMQERTSKNTVYIESYFSHHIELVVKQQDDSQLAQQMFSQLLQYHVNRIALDSRSCCFIFEIGNS